jgi:hypothetical protein
MVTTVKTSISAASLPAYLTEIAEMFSDKIIYLLGVKCEKEKTELPNNVALPENLKEFKLLLNSIN